MQTIWKYELNLRGKICRLEVPENAAIIAAAVVNDVPCVYFRLDPEEPKVTRSIAVYATGEAIDGYAGFYVGSVVLPGKHHHLITHAQPNTRLANDLVFHIYDVTGHPAAGL